MLSLKLVHSFENCIFALHILLRLSLLFYLKSLLYSVSTLSLLPSSVVVRIRSDPDFLGSIGSAYDLFDKKISIIFANFSFKRYDLSLISYIFPKP